MSKDFDGREYTWPYMKDDLTPITGMATPEEIDAVISERRGTTFLEEVTARAEHARRLLGVGYVASAQVIFRLDETKHLSVAVTESGIEG